MSPSDLTTSDLTTEELKTLADLLQQLFIDSLSVNQEQKAQIGAKPPLAVIWIRRKDTALVIALADGRKVTYTPMAGDAPNMADAANAADRDNTTFGDR